MWPEKSLVSLGKNGHSQKDKNGFLDRLSHNTGPKYCRLLPLEHSAILWTFIKLPVVIKTLVLFIFEWTFYTDFTVIKLLCSTQLSMKFELLIKTKILKIKDFSSFKTLKCRICPAQKIIKCQQLLAF